MRSRKCLMAVRSIEKAFIHPLPIILVKSWQIVNNDSTIASFLMESFHDYEYQNSFFKIKLKQCYYKF